MSLKRCSRCKTNLAEKSAVISGVYYKDLCNWCVDALNAFRVCSGYARWARSIDAEDHEADIQQPYNSDGSINVRFAKLYPKQASALFSEEQLRKAEL